MNVNIWCEDGANYPTRGHSIDAGLDLYNFGMVTDKRDLILYKKYYATFKTGLHIDIPRNHCGLIVSKSGLNKMRGITATGLIDSGYTGEVLVTLHCEDISDLISLQVGDKIAQLVIMPVVIPHLYDVKNDVFVDRIQTMEERGNNGFGSTGR